MIEGRGINFNELETKKELAFLVVESTQRRFNSKTISLNNPPHMPIGTAGVGQGPKVQIPEITFSSKSPKELVMQGNLCA